MIDSKVPFLNISTIRLSHGYLPAERYRKLKVEKFRLLSIHIIHDYPHFFSLSLVSISFQPNFFSPPLLIT